MGRTKKQPEQSTTKKTLDLENKLNAIKEINKVIEASGAFDPNGRTEDEEKDIIHEEEEKPAPQQVPKKQPKIIEEVIEEEDPEPIIIKKIIKKKKPKQIIEEIEEESDEEEKPIKKKKAPQPPKQQRPRLNTAVYSNYSDDILDQTNIELLRQEMKNEMRRRLMSSLFD